MKRYTRGTLDESVRAVFRRLTGAEPTTICCCWDSQLMDHSTRETGIGGQTTEDVRIALAAARIQGWRAGMDSAASVVEEVADRSLAIGLDHDSRVLLIAADQIRSLPEPDYSEEE